MKTLVIYQSPHKLGIFHPTVQEHKEKCFKIYKYETEAQALWDYAETPATWSTLLPDTVDTEAFIDEAFQHILAKDNDWLEENFV